MRLPVEGRLNPWRRHDPPPRPTVRMVGGGWPGEFQESIYGPRGSWDLESDVLHVACLMNPARHREGGDKGALYAVSPSVAVAVPGDGFRGGWSGVMRGRHLFLTVDEVERIAGDRFDRLGIERQPFLRGDATDDRDPALWHLIAALAAEARDGAPQGPAFAESVIAAILQKLRAKAGMRPTRGGSDGALAAWTRRAIFDRLGGRILLSDLAAEAGVSVQHLARTFRRREGLPPHQFIIRERVKAARAMIERSDVTLAEAALSAGFGDQSQMTATFRRVLGVTPGSLRRRR